MGGLIYLSPIFNGATIEAWINNFIPNLTGRVITYPCWGERWSMLVKGAPGEDTRKLTRKLSAWQTTPDLFWLWTYWRIAHQLIVLGFHYIKLHVLNFNIWRNIKIYLHFLPFLDTATLYVLGIPGKQQFYSQYHGCADDMTLVASAQTVLTQFPRISQTQSAPEGILTLNSIHGPFRPESNFAYTQHWYLADVTLKTLCILQPRLSEWRKPIKILKRKSRVMLYRS